MKRYKIFTHRSDLDGIGCAILAKLAFGDNVDIEYCEYNNINEKVQEFIDSKEVDVLSYEKVFITDISLNEEVSMQLDICFNHFVLLDHHASAEWMNKYDWCTVKTYTDETLINKNCATYMFNQYLLDNDLHKSYNIATSLFVETVRRYDTWEFSTKYNDAEPKHWNDLLYIYGREMFINKIIEQLKNNRFEFSSADLILLILNQEKIDRYIASKQKQIIEKQICGYNAGIVFVDQYQSEVGNVLSKNNPHLDFIAMININHSVSYRTVKENVNLTEVAKVYGGGGHVKASGSPIDKKVKTDLINKIFHRNKIQELISQCIKKIKKLIK